MAAAFQWQTATRATMAAARKHLRSVSVMLSASARFGGNKRSGNGREDGVHGLEEYLETKAILSY